jgi:hypothetical protein
MPHIPKEQIQEMVRESQRIEEESKKKFIEQLAEQIVVMMIKYGYTPKPKEKNYIG